MRLVLDTNIWIKALKLPRSGPHNENHQAEAVALLDEIVAGKHDTIMPASTLTEIVSAGAAKLPAVWESDTSLKKQWGEQTADVAGCFCERFREWVIRLVTVKDIDREFAYKAGICARLFNLRGMDAIVAFTAIEQGRHLVSEDKKHRHIPDKLNSIKLDSGTNWAFDIVEKARAIKYLSIADYPWPDMQTPEVPNG